ncbi:MAG: NUDIX domain-containing protein [Alphaproteobacteria bacterium]|jgi:8-oxo-dGTP diphosphatase|nr:NUDIX domain-containing protein [Alphaproteobacteria bacterium]MBT3990514.1 NUDIX domain-containing protein [Rhodospirillaceae bacterium]MBT5939018.1 NUDIX domain-containing protein [Rhodospirillaceae bacterium]MBT7266324.1 NUDIX domain-containing protein [Rhodospirillaceae bacterium]
MDDQRLLVVSLIIEFDEQILFMCRSKQKDHAPGEWEFPSGRVENGETPEQAAIREALEETGLDIEIVKIIDNFQFLRSSNQKPADGVTFHCRSSSNDTVPSEEHEDYCWLPFDESPSFDLPTGVLESLKAFRSQH